MKFTLKWLKDFLDTNASIDEIALALTSLGLEVESVSDRSEDLKWFIVAEILSAEQHPNADKLRVCQVFDGKNELQVVCGAPNARSGIKVVLAPIGAVIPSNGLLIKQSKIREVESQGMLCSATELKIGKDGEGIIELDSNSRVGDLFVSAAGLDDPVFDLSITPNRGDCLGVYGIARDLAAAGIGKLKPIAQKQIKEEGDCPIEIKLESNISCKRFTARYFKGIANDSQSQDLMKSRLQAVGAKSISTIVDITNIVCLSFSRPLHAYDADKIVGGVAIRLALKGEKFLALNEIEYEMKGGEVVVCDQSGIISLGGIIGGARTACSLNTKNILLEMAIFDPIAIAQAGRDHMIETDSRYRMERKLDEAFLEKADLIFSNMIIDFCGGTPSKNIDLVNEKYEDRLIDYSANYFSQLAGFEVPFDKVQEILTALGFEVNKNNGNEIMVKVPSYRNDITMKDDITEEILRVYGYDNIPSIPLPVNDHLPKATISKRFSIARALVRALAIFGYHELVTWSFMNKEKAELFAPLEEGLVLLNPISVELSYMRPTILANLLDAIKINQERGLEDLSFVELGPVFSSNYQDRQTKVCAGVRSGKSHKKSIHGKAQKYDVFDIKRDLFMLIEECGFDPAKMNLMQDGETPSYYHPAQSAALYMGKNLIAYFGKLNPQILASSELDMDSFAFELFLDNLPTTKARAGKRAATSFSDYQLVKRDFAFILDKHFPAGNLIKLIESTDKKLIQKVEIFDSFEGAAIGEGKKSIAFSVVLQASDRTLTEAEIDELSKVIIKEVAAKAGGIIRG